MGVEGFEIFASQFPINIKVTRVEGGGTCYPHTATNNFVPKDFILGSHFFAIPLNSSGVMSEEYIPTFFIC